jgi:hypothetical protein
MQTQPKESYTELYTTSLAVMKRLDKSGTRVWKELTSEQLNMVRLSMDYWNRQLEVLLSRDTPANLFAAQSGVATEFSMKFIDQWRKIFVLMTDVGSELMACSNQLKPYWSFIPSAELAAVSSPKAAVSEAEEEAAPRVIGKPKKSAA